MLRVNIPEQWRTCASRLERVEEKDWCDVAIAVSARMKGEVYKALVRVSVSDLVRLRGGGTEEKTGGKDGGSKDQHAEVLSGCDEDGIGNEYVRGTVHLRYLEIKPDSLDTSRGQMVNILVKGC